MVKCVGCLLGATFLKKYFFLIQIAFLGYVLVKRSVLEKLDLGILGAKIEIYEKNGGSSREGGWV